MQKWSLNILPVILGSLIELLFSSVSFILVDLDGFMFTRALMFFHMSDDLFLFFSNCVIWNFFLLSLFSDVIWFRSRLYSLFRDSNFVGSVSDLNCFSRPSLDHI